LDEVFIRINGVQHYIWRAVDQDGVVLDVLVQSRRNTKAAKRQIIPHVEHRQSRYLNNRAENSHQPTRQRERRMKRFKSPWQAQQFLSAHDPIHQHSHPRRHLMNAAEYRAYRTNAFYGPTIWIGRASIRIGMECRGRDGGRA
jgi:putative transposase